LLLSVPDRRARSGGCMQALAFWHSALPLNLPERLAELLADGLEGAGSWVRRWGAGAARGALHLLAETSLSMLR